MHLLPSLNSSRGPVDIMKPQTFGSEKSDDAENCLGKKEKIASPYSGTLRDRAELH